MSFWRSRSSKYRAASSVLELLGPFGFSAWLRCRPSGQQDGTQECNRCVQSHAVRRAAARARKRLETRRRTARQRAQIRAEIASVVQKRKGNDAKRHLPPAQPGIPVPGHDTSDGKRAKLQNCKDAPETETSATAADRRRTGLGPSQDETRKDAPNGCRNTNVSWTHYICPYCQISVQSTVRDGNVQVRGHCSKQFRVRHGFVVCSNTHSCPTCGAAVQSSCARGRIRIKHKRPNGKACPTMQWQVK